MAEPKAIRENDAATRIQSLVRGVADRNEMRKRNKAATCIQSLARGKAARKAAEHLREEEASRWSAQPIYRLGHFTSILGFITPAIELGIRCCEYAYRRCVSIRARFTLLRARVHEFYRHATRAHEFYHHAIRARDFCYDLYCGIARTINTPVIIPCCMVAAVVFASTVM
jgi:hypothetical protein